MQPATREWIHQTVDQLTDREAEQLVDYLEFLIWKSKQKAVVHGQRQPEPKQMGKNPMAQRIIEAVEKSHDVTMEDAKALLLVIKENQMPVRFDSPFKEQKPQTDQ